MASFAGMMGLESCAECGRDLRFEGRYLSDGIASSEKRFCSHGCLDTYKARERAREESGNVYCSVCGAVASNPQITGYQMDANGNPLCWACFDKANPQPASAAASGSSSGGARKGAVGSAAAAVATWSRARQITLALCIFLGIFGAHRFYVGKPKLAVLYIFTAGLAGWGWLVDLIMIILGKFKDKNGNPL